MTILQRVQSVFVGIIMTLFAALILYDSTSGFNAICTVLCIWLFIYGIKCLIFYQTMARHMVGGRMQLYRSIILLDFGVFTMSLTTIPKAYVILYLMGVHAFSGLVDILRAREAKKMEAPAWKSNMMTGVVNLGIAIICVTVGFIQNSVDSVVYIYAAGLVYSGIVKIVSSFKKTAIVYVQ